MNSHIALALAMAGALAVPAVQAQTCNANVRRSAPDARYVVDADKGTVLDQQTGLTWKRCIEGQSGADCGTGSPVGFNWGEALRQAEASTFAGYTDWRMPDFKELNSLVEVACHDPAINATVFPNDPSGFVWASSPVTVWQDWAWDVSFTDGQGDWTNRQYGLMVRFVGRPTGWASPANPSQARLERRGIRDERSPDPRLPRCFRRAARRPCIPLPRIHHRL